MAPVVTSLTSGALSTASLPATQVTASVTPAGGSVVLLWVNYIASVSATTLASVTGLGATWTRLFAQLGSTSTYLELWWCAPVASGTITMTNGGSATFDAVAWDVDQVTGVNPAAPFVTANTVSGAATTTSKTPTVTFTQAMTAGNIFVCGTGYNAAGTSWTQATGFTQITDAKGTATNYAEVLTSDNSAPGSTLVFTWTETGAVAVKWPAGGVELAAGSGVVPKIPQQLVHRGAAGTPGGTGSGASFTR